MKVLRDQVITNTDPVTMDHVTHPGAAASTYVLAATGASLTCSFRVYAGPTIGWVQFRSQSVTAETAQVVVIEVPKIPIRLVVTPSTGSGHMFVGVGDANTRGE